MPDTVRYPEIVRCRCGKELLGFHWFIQVEEQPGIVRLEDQSPHFRTKKEATERCREWRAHLKEAGL